MFLVIVLLVLGILDAWSSYRVNRKRLALLRERMEETRRKDARIAEIERQEETEA